MSENIFSILLLSDAHIGNPANALDSLSVFEPLFKDIRTVFDEDGYAPSLIVFSGDLAYSGKKEEYEQAKKYLERIFSCFNLSYGKLPILIVPGNHDVDRSVIDEPQKAYRQNLVESKVNEMMQVGDVTWSHIIDRQSNWRDFVKSIPDQPWKWDHRMNLCMGTLPVFGKNIGIVGLNSSWASHEQREQGFLWIGQHQYETGYSSIDKEADIKVAIVHHPTDWLHQSEKSLIRQRLESQFDIFCYGHEHTSWFTDSKGHLKCEVGACYEGSKGKNSYSWLYLDLTKKQAKIRLREYTNQGGGGWRANEIPGKPMRLESAS